MMGQVLAVAHKEILLLWGDRPALALLFLMPAFFIVVMSLSLESVFEAGTADRPIPVGLVDEDRGALAVRLRTDLGGNPGLEVVESHDGRALDVRAAEELIRTQALSVALVVPSGSSAAVSMATGEVRLSLLVDPATSPQVLAPVRGMIDASVQRAAAVLRLPAQIRAALESEATARGGRVLPDEMMAELEAEISQIADLPSGAQLETIHPRGMTPSRKPTATQQSVPAYAIFGVFFTTLTLATSFVRDRTDGVMARLLVSPLTTSGLLIGKLLPYGLVNLVQIAAMFAVGRLVFDIALGDPMALLLVSIAVSATANALGLFIATIARTEAQVGALAVSSSITLAALGGIMVPSYLMPGPMQTVALVTPHAWALSAYHDIMLRGGGVEAVGLEVAVLFGLAGFLFAASALRWRFA